MPYHIPMMPECDAKAATVGAEMLRSANGSAQIKRVLEEFGFAIVTGVLSPDEASSLSEAFADDLRGIIKLPNGDEKSALPDYKDPLREWSQPLSPMQDYFVSCFGLPHGKCGWGVRSHPNVKQVFASIFDTEDLCCGTDSIFFTPRPSEIPHDERKDRLWPHADQSEYLTPQGVLRCYQSIVYLWDCEKESSATVVWPGSHRTMYPRLMKRKMFQQHYCRLDYDEEEEFREHALRVPVPAGGMIVWDSRTIHQGWKHGKRLAVPVCFEPKERRPADVLEIKENLCREGIPTSHWASLGQPSLYAGGDGGSKRVPLSHTAHKHLMGLDDKLDPKIAALL